MTPKSADDGKSSPSSNASDGVSTSLPRRDWLLIPLLVLLTIVVLAGSIEGISRSVFRESKTTSLSCLVLDDPHGAVHAKPNTVCAQKIFESELTEFRFNDCGHRTSLPCAPPPAGTYRIVLLGSSLAEGMWVPVQQTFAAELPGRLSELTNRKVDLYNEAMQWGTPRSVDLRVGEVLAAKPDMVLWTVTPWDIEHVKLRLPYIPGKQEEDNGEAAAAVPTQVQQPAPHGLWQKLSASYHKYASPAAFVEAKWARLIQPLNETRTVFMLKHELYKSQNQFLKHYVMEGDAAGFLQKDTPKIWQTHLNDFDGYLGDVAAQLKASGVPLVVTVLPHRSQTDMISMGEWSSDVDPYLIGDQVKQIAERRGVTYFDILHDFRTIPNPDQYFFPVDGHMNANGHLVLTRVIAKELTSGVVPALKAPQPNEGAR
jgi:hypothetical protein